MNKLLIQKMTWWISCSLALAVLFGLLYLYGRYLYFHGYAESAQGRSVIQYFSNVHVCQIVLLTCYYILADWSRYTSVQRCNGCWSVCPGWGSSAPWRRPIWDWTCCTPLVMFWAWPNTHESRSAGGLQEAENKESFKHLQWHTWWNEMWNVFFYTTKNVYLL